MIVFEAYAKRDIVRYEILCPDGVGECARDRWQGGHTGVQLLYEIVCQHVVVVQARGQEPVMTCTILFSHMAIEKIDIFIERTKQDLNLRHCSGIGQQPTALCIRRLRVCQEYPSEVFASLLLQGREAVGFEQGKAVVQPSRREVQGAVTFELQIETREDDMAIGKAHWQMSVSSCKRLCLICPQLYLRCERVRAFLQCDW